MRRPIPSFLWTALGSSLVTKSPWAPCEWRINLEFDSNRAVVGFEALVESDVSESTDRFLLGSGQANVMSILEDGTYITMQGQKVARLTDAGWKYAGRRTEKLGDAAELRMFVDVADPIVKNDMTVEPARLYLSTRCWRQFEYDAGLKRLGPLKATLDALNQQIENTLDHATGDRRLDGTNLVDTALGSLDMAKLVAQRDDLQSQLSSNNLPSLATASGPWPGSEENLHLEVGKIEVRNALKLYETIGRWTATPLESSGEYEYEEVEEETSSA